MKRSSEKHSLGHHMPLDMHSMLVCKYEQKKCEIRIGFSFQYSQCSNCWGVGGVKPPPHLADPSTSGQNSTPGGRDSTPHLGFPEVGMLLDSYFLLMQFLKYLQHEDLNVTTILIHIED